MSSHAFIFSAVLFAFFVTTLHFVPISIENKFIMTLGVVWLIFIVGSSRIFFADKAVKRIEDTTKRIDELQSNLEESEI